MYDALIFGGSALFIVTPWAIFLWARVTVPRPTTDYEDATNQEDQDEQLPILITAQRGAPGEDARKG